MSDRPQDRLKPMGLSRLFGFKWIRRDDHVAVMRVPRWVPESVVRTAADRVAGDYEVIWPEYVTTITARGHLIRITWEAK